MTIHKHAGRFFWTLAIALAATAGGCSDWVYDDLPPCESSFRVRLLYDYNMKYADAFAREVKSVNMWVFDTDGRPVWSYVDAAGGADVEAALNQYVELPLPPGEYEIISWCGLAGNDGFSLADYTPASKADLYTSLLLKNSRSGSDGEYSDHRLEPLFHGMSRNIVIEDNPDVARDEVYDISLVKDTHYFQILLQNIGGRAMKESDFSFCIVADDSRLEWNNLVAPDMPSFDYRPWHISAAETEIPDAGNEGHTEVSTLIAEMTTSRLMADADARLVVTRNDDGRDIISIPLIDYLLLIKGHYREMGDQEYLDREDEFRITFFIDSTLSWYTANGIKINNWTVVPSQNEEL